jgi:hypothetical protein
MNYKVICVVALLIGVPSMTMSQPKFELDCSAFQKGTDGSWQVIKATTVRFGQSSVELKETKLTNNSGVRINGVRLVDYLNQNCK